MKLTEAKLKQLIIETMEEEELSKKDRDFLRDLLRHEDPDTRLQGVELASQMLPKEEFRQALSHFPINKWNVRGILDWMQRGMRSRGPRKALWNYIKGKDDVEKEKVERDLRWPNGNYWHLTEDPDGNHWGPTFDKKSRELTEIFHDGDIGEWETKFEELKDYVRSFYEQHAPGYWDSLTDPEQMGNIYARQYHNSPGEAAQASFDKAYLRFYPLLMIAEPLARTASLKSQQDLSWTLGYEDRFEDMDSPRYPKNKDYMQGWNDAVEEIRQDRW